MSLFICNLNLVVWRYWLQPSVILVDAERSKGAVRSEDEASLLLSISWALCDFREDIIFIIVVEVSFPELFIFLDSDRYLFSSVTISVEEICNEIVLVLEPSVCCLVQIVCSVSSNSALGAILCLWDRECLLSPCVEGFFFDSFIVSFPPLLVDLLFPLVGLIVCLTCGVVISPHCLHIFISLLFDFSCRSIL